MVGYYLLNNFILLVNTNIMRWGGFVLTGMGSYHLNFGFIWEH